MTTTKKRASNAELLDAVERVEKLLEQLLERTPLPIPYIPYVPPASPAPLTNGYRCSFCGTWVMYGTYHGCSGRITCGTASTPPVKYTIWNNSATSVTTSRVPSTTMEVAV